MKIFALAALAAAAAAPVFAQQPVAETPLDKHKTTKAERPAPVDLPSEAEVVAVLDKVDQDEVDWAQQALRKSTNAEVQEFARQMIVDHGENRRKLGGVGIQPAASGEYLGSVKEKHAGVTRKLDRLSGADFDRAYIGAMVDGHSMLLEKIDKKLAPASKTAALASTVQETRPVVEAHLEHARRIKKDLGTK